MAFRGTRLTALFVLALALALASCSGSRSEASGELAPSPAAYFASVPLGDWPATECYSCCVVDGENGAALLERNADAKLPPASLAKLMTMLLALEAVRAGRLSFDTMVTIDESNSYPSLPVNATRLGLKPGMRVSVATLLEGAGIASGNDCALALARTIGGSNGAFVEAMNARAAELGMRDTVFIEPSGLTEQNVSTALDMARLAFAYATEFPDALARFNGAPWVSVPGMDGAPTKAAIANLNPLVGTYEGCDGLKTGYILQSGSHIVASATRGGLRIIAVVMGRSSGPSAADQARALLDFSLSRFETVALPRTGMEAIFADAGVAPLSLVLPKGMASRLGARRDQSPAPFGTLVLSLDGFVVARLPATRKTER